MQDNSQYGGGNASYLYGGNDPQNPINQSRFPANQSSDFQNAAPADNLSKIENQQLQVANSGTPLPPSSTVKSTPWFGIVIVVGLIIVIGVVFALVYRYAKYLKTEPVNVDSMPESPFMPPHQSIDGASIDAGADQSILSESTQKSTSPKNQPVKPEQVVKKKKRTKRQRRRK